MKRLCGFFVFMIIMVLQISSCSQFTYHTRLKKLSTEAFEDHDFVSFEAVYDYWFYSDNDTIKHHFSRFFVISYDKNNQYYVMDDTATMCCIMVDEEKVECVNKGNNEYCTFRKQKKDDEFYSQYKYEVDMALYYLKYFQTPLSFDLVPHQMPTIESIIDTVVDGNEYILVNSVANSPKLNSTGEIVADNYNTWTWINNSTKLIDSITVNGIESNTKIKIEIKNVDFSDKSDIINNVFNIDNPIYSKFSKHTESFPPYSRLGSLNEKMNESLLNYPLINSATGDSTSLAKCDGWLLLNFWFVGCTGCVEEFSAIQQEKDSLGYRLLEDKGIKILAVNVFSDNHELILEVSKRFQFTDIAYSGKGICQTLAAVNKGYPSNYLISPDKQIVWRENHLGDYSELLKAKEDYEKIQKTN